MLSVKYKLQALPSSFDLWGDVKPWSSFNKNKSTNQCAFLRHSHARSPLVFCFSFSPNMFEMNNFNPRIIKEKNPFWLLVYRMIMPLAERLSSTFHICPRIKLCFRGQMFIFRTISQPRALSSDILAAGRGLFTKYNHFSMVGIRI